MTSDAPARRLLAGLVDERALETEPIADVRADLAALGLDPARAVALARRLAAGAATPAVTLLGRIEEAEESDDEIRHLEQADIAAVRRNLAEGTAAATIANAQRAAGQQATVVGLRRRRPRRLLYGLGGVAAALAASVVFYVGLSTNQLHYDARDKVSGLASAPGKTTTSETASVRAPMTPPAEEPYGSVVDPQVRALPAAPPNSDVASASQQAANETDDLQARMEPSGTGQTQPAEQGASVPASPQQSADAEVATRAKSEADANQATGNLDRPESQLANAQTQPQSATGSSVSAGEQSAVPRPEQELADEETGTRAKANQQQLRSDLQSLNQPAASGTQASSFSPEAEQISADELRAAVRSRNASVLFGLTQPVTDLLIVNPRLMPPDVRQEDYSVGNLSARLDEARKAAIGRSIVALVTVRGADRSHDAVIIAKPFEIDFDAGEQKVQEQLLRAIRARRAYQIIELDDR